MALSKSAFAFDSFEEPCDNEKLERGRADPMVQVSDLTSAIDSFFEVQGYRSIEPVMTQIRLGGCTWKTAPKVWNFMNMCI